MFTCTAEEQKSKAASADGTAKSPDPQISQTPAPQDRPHSRALVKFHVVYLPKAVMLKWGRSGTRSQVRDRSNLASVPRPQGERRGHESSEL